jgi:hypothetical protein
MNERRMIQATGFVVALLVVLALPLWAGETTNISGTIVALNKEAGTIVVGEVGPWRVKEGATEITPRTVAVTAGTEFKQVRRAEGAGPTGWVGEFVEVAIGPWELKKGDFVTVQVRHEEQRLTALKVAVSAVVEP